MDLQTIGRVLLFGGLALAAVGGLLLIVGRVTGADGLPGDLRIQTGNLTCFFPITTMIVLSVVLTIVLNILIRIINR